MTILAGLLILTCAGLMVGHGYHMFRHKETPKSEHHMTMHGEPDHGQPADPSSGNPEEAPKEIPAP